MNDSSVEEMVGETVPRCAQGSTGLLLTFLGAAVANAGERRLPGAGVTGREYTILSILETNPPGSQQEIARLIGKVPAMIVPALDELERRGLVARSRDPADRRRTRVRLTDEGARALAAAHRVADEVVGGLLPGLDRDELRTLHRLLERGLGFAGDERG